MAVAVLLSGPKSTRPHSLDCSRRLIFLLASTTRSEARLPPSQAARDPPDSISDKEKYQHDPAGVRGGGLEGGKNASTAADFIYLWER